MIEWIVPSLIIAGAAAIPKGKTNDKKIIKEIFENVGYGIRKKSGDVLFPKFKKKEVIMDIYIEVIKEDGKDKEVERNVEIGYTYRYSIIPGLPATKMKESEEKMKIFADALQKPVEINFGRLHEKDRKTLNIHVYDAEIPTLLPYETIPKRKDEWVVPLGKSIKGLIWHNFDHIPHMTIAGTTRFGKTVLLRVLMTYLIECHSEDVEFYIIDLKGGLEFSKYESIRQVKAVATDIDESIALLTYLTNKLPNKKKGEDYGLLEKEYIEFRRKGISNIVDTDNPKRRFIIVDEGAQLAPDTYMEASDKAKLISCQSKLSRLAAVGGALGWRLLFATQYPTSDTLPRQIKQNSDAKITFRLPSGYASDVAIDAHGAEELPSNVKGRALFKTHELKEMQVPYLTHDQMWDRLEEYQIPITRTIDVDPINVVEQDESPDDTPDIPHIDLFK